MHGVVINGAINRNPGAQKLEMLDQKLGFKGLGAIVVERCPLLIVKIGMGTVIVIMADHRHILAEMPHDLLCQGSFSAAGAPGDADQNRGIHVFFLSCLPLGYSA